MRPLAENRGRSFLRYSDAKKARDAVVNVQEIEEAHEALAIFRKHAKHFKRTTLISGYGLIFDELQDAWRFTDDDKVGWVETMTNRTMNILSVVAAYESKRKWVAWVYELPWNKDACNGGGNDGGTTGADGTGGDDYEDGDEEENAEVPVRTRAGDGGSECLS